MGHLAHMQTLTMCHALLPAVVSHDSSSSSLLGAPYNPGPPMGG